MFQQSYESYSRNFISCYKSSIFILFFFLVKATDFWSQLCIKCFSKSSCMMLRPFPLRLMDFMISYRIRSCISVASPQFSAQMGQTVTTIFFTSWYVGRGHYALDPTIKDKSVHFPILQMLWALDHACAEISIATDVSRTYLLEQFTCHDNVVRTIENWCRHLDCRVIQCMLPKLSDLVGNEPSPIKRGKTTSQHQVHHNSARAIMVSSLHQASQPKRQKSQSYGHCGQFVIYTVCICECVQRFRWRT